MAHVSRLESHQAARLWLPDNRFDSARTASMSARHTRIRRLAAQVLLLWLLALVSGIVNACVIVPQAMQAQPAAHEACGACPEQHQPAHGACAKFCADESSSLPSAQQAFDPGPALAIAPLPTMALAEPALPALERPGGAPPPRARIPIPIAFLRLTI